ncbi:MAG: hypothetical protein WCS01_10850 [bacterium]
MRQMQTHAGFHVGQEPPAGRLRVAFFQRIFAHYQAGLVKELAAHSRHDYRFIGAAQDPLGSGIEVITGQLCARIPFSGTRWSLPGGISKRSRET